MAASPNVKRAEACRAAEPKENGARGATRRSRPDTAGRSLTRVLTATRELERRARLHALCTTHAPGATKIRRFRFTPLCLPAWELAAGCDAIRTRRSAPGAAAPGRLLRPSLTPGLQLRRLTVRLGRCGACVPVTQLQAALAAALAPYLASLCVSFHASRCFRACPARWRRLAAAANGAAPHTRCAAVDATPQLSRGPAEALPQLGRFCLS
jgi:hypothetical protein